MLLTAFLPAAILLAAFPSGLLAKSFETEQKCDKYFSFVRSPAGVESAECHFNQTITGHPFVKRFRCNLKDCHMDKTSKRLQVDPGTPITYAVAAGEIKTYDDSNPLNTFLVDVRKYGTQTWYLCTKAIISCGGCTPWVDSAS
ncbi:hypothetical protein PtA15_5A189 [Puccinia triticina]|uniref:Uncharacterized protein n=1 Tax=Puccinia triticina TaxID=208348 RepID=A0ABY7CHC3_9BASI|nr:uncharacterized protein PtA15_5A189 [Puccinia triticina]WAQ84616.1 hypothetical protein PtA15_5A189 [Puccinia triticina]